MLQQTTVTAVVPYFNRWMIRFPTVKALALANEQEVMTLWQGLGYYSRARNLLRAVQVVNHQYDGVFPTAPSVLRTLPGVGDYTSNAVAAFAFDEVVPVVDANIARVLARLNNWQRAIDDAAGKAFLRRAATELLPRKGGRLHSSALMELGALVCTAQKPHCQRCPIRSDCQTGDPISLPIKRGRPVTLAVSERRAFVMRGGKLWLELSQGPRWRGLWLLPKAMSSAEKYLHLEIFPITRFKVTMQVLSEPRRSPKGLQGFLPGELPPMPSPHTRAVAALLTKVHSAA